MAEHERHDREVERLEAENAELRQRNEELMQKKPEERPPASRGRSWRWAGAILLLIVGGFALAGGVAAVWANGTLLDTDQYTETVAPLASEPAIQESVSETAVNKLFTEADVEDRAREALPPDAEFLAAPLTGELRSLATNVSERAMGTPQFQQLWVEANRRMHEALVPVLTGEESESGAISAAGGTITLDISNIVSQVKQVLVENGITIVENIPEDAIGGQIVLFQSDRLAQIQTYVQVLQGLAVALPVIALLALAGAILLAPDRRRGFLWVGVTAILAMVLLGAGLALARSYYLDAVDRAVLSPAAAAAFFDVMVRFLRNGIRTVAAVGLVFLLGAAVAGPSRAAVAIRATTRNGVDGLASSLGLDLGPFSEWVSRHRRALDIALLLVLGVVLLGVSSPTPGLVLGLAIAAILGLVLIELLAAAHMGPPRRGQPSA